MKLLIVDDEELTRNGLISSINWFKYGINEIYQADDGINGILQAKEHRPDIILCDIRMPRMSGIKMIKEIKKDQPDVCTIFMSGFSDREYLKAAIKLNVLNFIDKPIDPKELDISIKDASSAVRHLWQSIEINENHKEHVLGKLAYYFTLPYHSSADKIKNLIDEYPQSFSANDFRYIFTIAMRFKKNDNENLDYHSSFKEFSAYLSSFKLHMAYCDNDVLNPTIHIYGKVSPSSSTLGLIYNKLLEIMAPFKIFHISVSGVFYGISNAYDSYISAINNLQTCYFFKPCLILDNRILKSSPSCTLEKMSKEANNFIDAVSQLDRDASLSSLNTLYESLSCHKGITINQLKSTYYKMLSALSKSISINQISPSLISESSDTIFDAINYPFDFFGLHSILSDALKIFFESNSSENPEKSVIHLIKDYIRSNYKDENLSVKSISEYMNMSISYTCTVFKNEMNVTLNQYITNYRIEKAKRLLADPRNRIKDIASKTGYSDGNYFSKCFKKYTNLSPSDYREQVIGIDGENEENN